MFVRCALVCVFAVLAAGTSRAQVPEPSDAWLMQNYRFTGPIPARELRPADPLMSELQDIQNTTLAILRKADFEGDYQAALAAAWQATANAQLMAAISGRLQPPRPPKPAPNGTNFEPTLYLIEFKDQTVQLATSYWADKLMLHYMTPQGAHEQVRLENVDRTLPVNSSGHR